VAKVLKLKLEECTYTKIEEIAISKKISNGEIIRKALVLYMIALDEKKEGRGIVFTNEKEIKEADKEKPTVKGI